MLTLGQIVIFGGNYLNIFLPHKARVNLINLFDLYISKFLVSLDRINLFLSPDRRRRRPGNVLMILLSQGSRLALEHTQILHFQINTLDIGHHGRLWIFWFAEKPSTLYWFRLISLCLITFSEIFKIFLFSSWEVPCSQIPDSQEKINCWNFWISRRQCLSKETTLVDRWDKGKKTLCQQRLSNLIRILGDK